MRAVWALIVLVFIAAGVAMVRSGGAAPKASVTPATPSTTRPASTTSERDTTTRDAAARAEQGSVAGHAPEPRLERPIPREETRPEAPALKLDGEHGKASGTTPTGDPRHAEAGAGGPVSQGSGVSPQGQATPEPARQVAPRLEPSPSESPRAEAEKPQATKAEAGGAEQPRPEAPKPEAPKSEPTSAEPIAPKLEPTAPEAPKAPVASPEPARVEAKPTGAPGVEPTKPEPIKSEPASKPETGKADGSKLESSGAPELEAREDGSVLVDKKYVLRGKGTAEAPYQVTWDQLLSAQDEYVPREGRKKVPGRIMMLHGKVVEVSGYIAFPLMADSSDELLSMMNQWDGCCIGVPPTPYDAVEVRLAKVVEGKERQTSFGVVRGTLRVEPHLVGGWLVGLYVMDGATLKPEAFNGFAP